VKSILLWRHAKSAWGNPGLADHERPLNRRGERAAEAMAGHIARLEARPDQILCSTAVRARQTLAPLLDRLAPAPPTSIETGLYLASEETLLERLQVLPPDVGTVLLIGHNDGIWLLANDLAAKGPTGALANLRDKYPTGALAHVIAPIERWEDLAAGQTTLVSFVRPRDLDSELGGQ
jgi:phosphohistidine phosphatase